MRTTLYTILLVAVASLAAGCTDATRSKWGALGCAHSVKLYSGGQCVEQWTSTGVVRNEDHSDGYYFTDAKTGLLVRVTGDLVITPIN